MKKILPVRKRLRLNSYDYSKEGMYFITICTKNREKILSKIVSNNVGVDTHGDSKIQLTNIGEIVNKIIKNYEEITYVKLHNYVIMPNHIHMIIILKSKNIPFGRNRFMNIL